MNDSAMRTLDSFRQYVTAPNGAAVSALSRVFGRPDQAALKHDLDILVEGGLLAIPTEGLYALTHKGWSAPDGSATDGDDDGPWISFAPRTGEKDAPKRNPRDRRR